MAMGSKSISDKGERQIRKASQLVPASTDGQLAQLIRQHFEEVKQSKFYQDMPTQISDFLDVVDGTRRLLRGCYEVTDEEKWKSVICGLCAALNAVQDEAKKEIDLVIAESEAAWNVLNALRGADPLEAMIEVRKRFEEGRKAEESEEDEA